TFNAFALLQLSDKAEVSILTCSPGSELYSTFGHSAFRIADPEKKIDWVYNYGTFEFSDDFYVKFAQGKLNYALSKTTFDGFTYEYIFEGREVVEQQLILNQNQKQAFLEALEENFQPENRYYRYDFFFDNCSTRLREMLEKILGDDLVWTDPIENETMTFREMIEQYQGHMPWGDFGIDLALGLPCDAYMVHPEDMFIPEYMQNHLAVATYKGQLIAKPITQVIPREELVQGYAIDWPMILSCLLLMVNAIWAFRAIKRKDEKLWLDRAILIFFGTIGVAVFLLWFATDHTITKVNLNLVWAFPLHLLAAFFLKKAWIKHYFAFFTIVLFAFLVSEWWWPMDFHHTFWPLAACLFITCVRMATLPSHWGNAH
ncbi:MAG: DUF4105 domain-containing protein, partial [Flavobacteriales bacterium]